MAAGKSGRTVSPDLAVDVVAHADPRRRRRLIAVAALDGLGLLLGERLGNEFLERIAALFHG